MRHHNPLCQRGIGPSLTCRVEILLDKDLRQSLQFPGERGTAPRIPSFTRRLGFCAEGLRIGS